MSTRELTTGILQSRSALPATLNRVRRLTRETSPNVDDVVNDLGELHHLISDLDQLQTSADDDKYRSDSHALSERWLHTNFSQAIQILKSRYRRHLDLVERATRWANSRELASLLATVRKEYLAIKAALRVAYRQRGTLLCAADWQSPSYASSVLVGMNRLSQGIEEHAWDYKRDGHLDALAYEEQFASEYVAHLGSSLLRAYLTNSGMAAFATVLHWLAHELQSGASSVALRPMYFENLHLAGAFFPNLLQIESPSSEELLSFLRSEQPSVVLCDAVTNCGEVVKHDLDTVLGWARAEANHSLSIVIDSTCLPSLLLPAGLLENLPENVAVVLIESLAKYHQFGMDIVTGGVAVLHAQEAMHESFRKTRARLGTNIADASVGSLPRPGRERLTQRMHRHSRNTRLLAGQLEELACERAGIIESVSWQSEGTDAAPWYRSSCFSIRLKEPFKSIRRYREFETHVLQLAEQKDHPLALGTSFGFDLSRLYVTAPATAFEEPFLRISVGTETATEILAFAEILATANVELAGLWDAQPCDKRIAKNTIRPAGAAISPLPARPLEKPGLPGSIYLGESALKDYLSPANYAPTPLVELPSDLNPFRSRGVRLLAKMMPLVPLMNIKSLPAFSMLSQAAERGDLDGVESVIESSSSNTVLSLSVMARLFGIKSTCAIVDHSIAPSLLRMLRLFGIEVFLHPGPGHELFGRLQPRSERAAACGKQPGWLNPGQYSNPGNPEGFARWLAPDLWAQTQGRIAVLSCALGTCGTMVGVSRALRARNPALSIVACCPSKGHSVPGPRERSLLSDVSFSWQGIANACLELTAKESFSASVRLVRRGILGGPSSGMNYAGVLRFLEQEEAAGRLESLVQPHGELWCVFLCCDSPLPHVDEYYQVLGDEYFPTVHAVPEEDEPVNQRYAH